MPRTENRTKKSEERLLPAAPIHMRFAFILALFLSVFLSGCFDTQGPSSPTIPSNSPNTAAPFLNAQGANVMSVQVGGTSLCGTYGYLNEPCVTVTVCVPGTNTCQTISDILLDTGSTGLRVFSSVLNLSLPPIKDSSGNTIAQCAQFGTGSDWGSLASADVVLGNEPAATVPIQLIDKNLAGIPSQCQQADIDPRSAGYNGILGLGLFKEDCGLACEQDSTLQIYYSCTSSTCTSTTVQKSQQLQNPIPSLPTDNNGLIVALPAIDPQGVSSASGVVILGIGTNTNNSVKNMTAFSADDIGNFFTSFNNQILDGSFIDSGSNGLFFPNLTSIANCDGSIMSSDFYCPPSTLTLSAIPVSSDGKSALSVSFNIANADTLVSNNTSALAFANFGGSGSSNSFDWGLPFFFGRAVAIGVENTSSSLGTGSYWAF